MIITLYGEDSYRREERLKFILSEYRKKHSGFTVETFDFSSDECTTERSYDCTLKLREFVSSVGLFESSKLAIVRGIDELEDVAVLKKNLKEKTHDKSVTILISEDKLPKGFEFLTKPPEISERFALLKGIEFLNFAKKVARERGIKIGEAVLVKLSEIFNGNSWGLINELNKLSLWGQEVTVEILKDFGLFKAQEFFPLVSGWNYKKMNEKLANLEILTSQKEDPAKVFNIMAYGGGPLNLKKFADYDVLIKSGKLEYDEALLELALE